MATNTENVVMFGTKGMFAQQMVIRRRGNKLVYCKKPGIYDKIPTEGQQAVRDRFREASQYAKLALADETMKAAYKAAAKTGQSAYNVALADAFRAPEIKGVDSSTYTGLPQSVITIRVEDDFRVQSVYVTILDTGGAIVEEGPAVNTAQGPIWSYTAVNTLATLPGSTIKVQATDLPGNAVILEHAL